MNYAKQREEHDALEAEYNTVAYDFSIPTEERMAKTREIMDRIPDPPTYPYEDIAKALAKIRKQHRKGKPLKWTGPDVLHHSIAASTPAPSWYFSEEGLEYEAERGRGFWDVYTQVGHLLGMHNGTVAESKHTKSWKRLADLKEDAPTRKTTEGEPA